MNVVWLKRDVRLTDHEPLCLALACEEPVLLLYIYEPAHLQSDTYHESHHIFINEGLAELDEQARALSGGAAGITYRRGGAVAVLTALHAQGPVRRLFSHREVGNAISRERNEAVAAWAAASGVEWTQCMQDGVSEVRHEELDEGSWASKWTAQMQRPQLPPPTALRLVSATAIAPGTPEDAVACGVVHRGARPSAQRGGEARALATLRSFLETRGEAYSGEPSAVGRANV